MHILLVEDDESFARLIKKVLELEGNSVELRAAAIGICNRVAGRAREPLPPVDVVILDGMLPGISGATALESLAADPATRNVPVILHSALSLGELRPIAARHPRCVPLEKTGRLRTLIAMISSVGRHRTPVSVCSRISPSPLPQSARGRSNAARRAPA